MRGGGEVYIYLRSMLTRRGAGGPQNCRAGPRAGHTGKGGHYSPDTETLLLWETSALAPRAFN